MLTWKDRSTLFGWVNAELYDTYEEYLEKIISLKPNRYKYYDLQRFRDFKSELIVFGYIFL